MSNRPMPLMRGFPQRAARCCRIALVVVLGVCLGCEKPPAPPPQTPKLHDAAKAGEIETVRSLLAQGADVHAKDQYGATALHEAAAHGRKDVVELLLSKGADVNAADVKGLTPLHQAASNGHAAVVKVLLDNGADPDARDMRGRTPLQAAALSNQKEAADVLIRAAAPPAEPPEKQAPPPGLEGLPVAQDRQQ